MYSRGIKMKKRLTLLLMTIAVVMTLAACGSLIANKSGDGDSDSSGFSNSGSKKIGILMPGKIRKVKEKHRFGGAFLFDILFSRRFCAILRKKFRKG